MTTTTKVNLRNLHDRISKSLGMVYTKMVIPTAKVLGATAHKAHYSPWQLECQVSKRGGTDMVYLSSAIIGVRTTDDACVSLGVRCEYSNAHAVLMRKWKLPLATLLASALQGDISGLDKGPHGWDNVSTRHHDIKLSEEDIYKFFRKHYLFTNRRYVQ